MRNHVLSFKELTTLFCPVAKKLNSRPIDVFFDDLKDGEVLTQPRLICATKLETFPTIETPMKLDFSKCTATTIRAHIWNVILHFWKRWNKKFVTSLQEKKKWSEEVSNVKIGDVVFITDDNIAHLQ